MTEAQEARFELRRVSESERIVRDHRYPAHDARGTIACISQLDEGGCEVTWLVDVALPARYASAAHVLEALRRSASRDAESSPNPPVASVEAVPASRID